MKDADLGAFAVFPDDFDLSLEQIEIMKTITGDDNLSQILPKKIIKSFEHSGYSLFDIFKLTNSELLQFRSFGVTKIEILKDFRNSICRLSSDELRELITPNLKLELSSEHKEVLNSIRGESVFMKLFPSLIASQFVNSEMSLLEIFELSSSQLECYPSFGAKKIKVFNEFKRDFCLRLIAQEPGFLFELDKVSRSEIRLVILPEDYDVNGTLMNNLLLFFKDWISKKEERGRVYDVKRAKIRRIYFGLTAPRDLDQEQIATQFGLTSQSISDIVNLNFQPFLRSETIEMISMHNDLIEKLKTVFLEQMYRVGVKDEFFDGENYTDKQLIRFLACFGYDLAFIDQESYLIHRGEIIKFRKHHLALDRILGKSVEAVSFEYLCDQMMEECSKEDCDFSIEMLHGLLSQDKIVVNSDGDYAMYSYDWPFLNSISSRMGRLGLSFTRSFSKKEFIDLYNETCDKYGCIEYKKDELFFRQNIGFHSKGNNYFVFIGSNQDIPDKDSTQNMVENFILERGGHVYFDDVKSFILNQGKNLADRALKTYVQNVARYAKKPEGLYVHKSVVANHPDITFTVDNGENIGYEVMKELINILNQASSGLRKKELIDLCWSNREDKGWTFGNRQRISEYYKRLVDSTHIIEDSINTDIWCYLNNPNLELSDIYKSRTPAYYQVIENQAIQLLKENGNQPLALHKIFVALRQFYPSHLSKAPFYKIINRSQFFNKIVIGAESCVQLKSEFVASIAAPDANEAVIEYGIMEPVFIQQVQPASKSFDWDHLKELITPQLHSVYRLPLGMIEVGMKKLHSVVFVNNEYEVWAFSAFRALYKVLTAEHDRYDLNDCVFKFSLIYETYLNKLIDVGDKSGLREKLSTNDALNNLYKYNYLYHTLDPCDQDSTERARSKRLNTLVYLRNKFSHDAANTSIKYDEMKYMETIYSLLSTYIYTSYLLRNAND